MQKTIKFSSAVSVTATSGTLFFSTYNSNRLDFRFRCRVLYVARLKETEIKDIKKIVEQWHKEEEDQGEERKEATGGEEVTKEDVEEVAKEAMEERVTEDVEEVDEEEEESWGK